MSIKHTAAQLTVRDDGEACVYALLSSPTQWFASVRLNGEQSTEQQRANIEHMAVAFNTHDDLVKALKRLTDAIELNYQDMRPGIASYLKTIIENEEFGSALAKAGAA